MRVVYFSSKSGNTHKFVSRLAFSNIRIPFKSDEPIEMDTDFVLICPSFSDNRGRGAVPPQVIKFLNNPINRSFLKGVVGGGNMNFGYHYAYAADVISAKCQVPILYRFELSGMESDVIKLNNILRKI